MILRPKPRRSDVWREISEPRNVPGSAKGTAHLVSEGAVELGEPVGNHADVLVTL
jgi:hypothetical protein